MPPAVSVVIPVFNGAHLVAKSLAALGHQTYPVSEFEVVIADDGSSDEIADAIDRWRGGLTVRLVRQPRRGFRLASARNLGIAAASGRQVISLDADMIPGRDLVATHVAALCDDVQTVSIGPRAYIDATGISAAEIAVDPSVVESAPAAQSASNWFSSSDRRLPELERMDGHPAPYSCLHGCNCAYWKKSAQAVGGYDVQFDGAWGYEDTEFAFRLWAGGAHFVVSWDALAWHQENDAVSFDERVRGDQLNFEKACAQIPGFREFKRRLVQSGRQPWW